MRPNPVLSRLGFSQDDRVVIIHTDDIGMCQASVEAFAELVEVGLISSGAVMVPCPWFLEAAAFAKANPEVDLGVHLTLTSEWRTYRWGPISTRDVETGLMDDEGFFPHTSEEVWRKADPDAALVELEMQIHRALAAGMTPTHIDTHMGSVAHPALIPGYVQLSIKHRLPPMIPRLSADELAARGDVDPEAAKMMVRIIHQLEEMGIPLLDALSGLALENAADRMAQAKQALLALKPGLTHFIIHPSKDTPELRHITESWDCRVADYRTFMQEELREFMKDEGIHVIGYRALKNMMPSENH
jgi:chitin disaccharide deacetylase